MVDGGTNDPLGRGRGLRGVGPALLPAVESADDGREYVRLVTDVVGGDVVGTDGAGMNACTLDSWAKIPQLGGHAKY